VNANVLPHADSQPGNPVSAPPLFTGRVLAAFLVSAIVACLWWGPLRWTGWLAAFGVAAHAAVCLRPKDGLSNGQSDSRGLKELALGGVLASLAVWLVIITGLREASQLALFDSIYFPYLRNDEMGYGWRLCLLYAGVTASVAYVYVRHRVLPGRLHLLVAPAVLLLFFHTLRFSPELAGSEVGNLTWDLLRVVTTAGIGLSAMQLWKDRDLAEVPTQRRRESWLLLVLLAGTIAPVSSNLIANRIDSSVIVFPTFLITFLVVCLSLFAWYWKRKSDSGWPIFFVVLALAGFSLVRSEQLLALGIGKVAEERSGRRVLISAGGLRFRGSPMQTTTYSSSRINGGGTNIRLEWKSTAWQIQLGTLVDIARLQGYTVDAKWCEAFASYGDRGWVRIELESKDDPRLQDVQDAVVRHVYAISPQMTSGSAWECLERIAASTTQLPYLTDSYRGRAVELLAERLDANRLADFVIELLRDENPAFLRRSMRETDSTDSIRFSTGQQRSKAGGAEDHAVFWHATVATDRVLDANGAKDNPLESRVVPQLIRHVLLGGNTGYNAFFRAKLIGGPEFDTFLLRHDWESEVTAPETPYEMDPSTTLRFGTRSINRWLGELLNLDSEAGRRFRREHEAMILELTARSLEDPPKRKLSESDVVANMVFGILAMNRPYRRELPEHLMFLFLDPAQNGEKSLAMKFWPEFCRRVDKTRMLQDWQRLAPKLAYLSRMWPEATEDMFVQLAVDHMDSVSTFSSTTNPLLSESLEDEVRFHLLEKIKQAMVEKALGDKSSNAEVTAERWRICFRDYQMRLSCPQSSRMILNTYVEDWDADDLEERLNSTSLFQRNSHLVRTFSLADRADFRLAALEAILNVPMPDRMPLLEAMLNDQNKQVASRAQEVRQKLDSLQLIELPYRSPKDNPLAAASTR
jgi:hypothetical protein